MIFPFFSSLLPLFYSHSKYLYNSFPKNISKPLINRKTKDTDRKQKLTVNSRFTFPESIEAMKIRVYNLFSNFPTFHHHTLGSSKSPSPPPIPLFLHLPPFPDLPLFRCFLFLLPPRRKIFPYAQQLLE